MQLISQFNNLLSPSEAISFSNLSAHTPSQKNLSDKLEQAQFSSLLDSRSWSDRARLMSVTSPHAAAWISVTPSISLGCRGKTSFVPISIATCCLDQRRKFSYPMNFKLPYNGGLASILYLVMMELRWYAPSVPVSP